LYEEKETAEICKLGGGFWEGDPSAVARGVLPASEETVQRDEEKWENDVQEE
jgi:hypothetical protein